MVNNSSCYSSCRRDIFKNLSDIGVSDASIDSDVAFIAMEGLVFVLLFATSLYFRSQTAISVDINQQDESIRVFVIQKKHLASGLAIVYVLVAMFVYVMVNGVLDGETSLAVLYFSNFFTWLIVSDIIILLVSQAHTDFLNQEILVSFFLQLLFE